MLITKLIDKVITFKIKMKFFALVALAAAQDETVDYGHDCIKEQACLKKPELTCINTADGANAYCQDCSIATRTWEDGVVFACPDDTAGGEEEGSASLVASAAALLAGAALIA